MWIHEDFETILLGDSQDLNGMIYEVFVVFTGPSVLQRFPGEKISYGVVSPALESGEMLVCVSYAARAIDKADIVAVEEGLRDVRWYIGMGGKFHISSEVDAVKHNLPVPCIPKAMAIDPKWS
jgi:hypothetical protein